MAVPTGIEPVCSRRQRGILPLNDGTENLLKKYLQFRILFAVGGSVAQDNVLGVGVFPFFN
jgi:hypothetical protein